MKTLRRGKPIGPSVPYSDATALSVSASSGNSKPPCLVANRSWLATSWAEMARTWAPSSLNCSRPSLYALSCFVQTGVSSPG